MPRWGVVIFPGSNCDRDVIHVLRHILREKDVRTIWHEEESLADFGRGDWIILPGGFSYGDYLRPGAIARLSAVIKAIPDFLEHGGYVLGICNGFQILCESGFLPGALVRNLSTRFICQTQQVRITSEKPPLTRGLKNRILQLPIAHSDGRYVVSPTILQEMKKRGQIVFQYTENPNGSMENIAGICNAEGNVIGLMPHPERNADPSVSTSPDGLLLFHNMLKYSGKNS